jgi:hypothetical protein
MYIEIRWDQGKRKRERGQLDQKYWQRKPIYHWQKIGTK